MYIAIEGLKGSGKSTLLDQLLREEVFVDASLLTPTRPSSRSTLHEQLWRCRAVRRIDSLRQWIYSRRANLASRNCDGSRPLVIGDRSKLTSYATRWQKWGNPYTCIRYVNRQQPWVPLPTHVVFLDLPVDRILPCLADVTKPQTACAKPMSPIANWPHSRSAVWKISRGNGSTPTDPLKSSTGMSGN